jgi:hypothetical protein
VALQQELRGTKVEAFEHSASLKSAQGEQTKGSPENVCPSVVHSRREQRGSVYLRPPAAGSLTPSPSRFGAHCARNFAARRSAKSLTLRPRPSKSTRYTKRQSFLRKSLKAKDGTIFYSQQKCAFLRCRVGTQVARFAMRLCGGPPRPPRLCGGDAVPGALHP